MAEYIKREDIFDAMCDNCDTRQAVCPHFPCKRFLAVEKISPVTIRDIVLCENCKWWKRHSPSFGDCHNPRWGDGHGWYAPPVTGEEAFCKYAERRTDEAD